MRPIVFGIDAFVRKMERLYTVLHGVSHRTRRDRILKVDLSSLQTPGIESTSG